MSFAWFNEPKKWSNDSSVIRVHTDSNTDFWQKTHYGFERDNGHFYYQSFPGDQSLTATVQVRGQYKTLYDQGGLMLRHDEKNWIKCGVEYVNGKQFASTVVTVNGWSDWNVVAINSPDVLKLRAKRDKEAVEVEFAEGENGEYQMMRLAYFPVSEKTKVLKVGVMCASPTDTSPGFDVSFEGLNITENEEKH